MLILSEVPVKYDTAVILTLGVIVTVLASESLIPLVTGCFDTLMISTGQ